MKRTKTLRVVLTAVAILALAWIGIRLIRGSLIASPHRKILPEAAASVHDWYWSEPGVLGQDYVYLLAAEITHHEFWHYVEYSGMMSLSSEPQVSQDWVVSWYPLPLPGHVLQWWAPSHGNDDTWISGDTSLCRYAKYEDGTMYLVVVHI